MAPDWEDDANKAGGRWVARRVHRQVDDAWLNLLLLLIGDHVEMEIVTGAVVSVRKAGDKLALWIKEAGDLETVVKVVLTVDEPLYLKTLGGKDNEGKAGIARAREAAVQPAQVDHTVCLLLNLSQHEWVAEKDVDLV